MAYYNGFPAGYQQMVPQYTNNQAQTTGLIWVQGEAAAKSYLVAPGCTVALWDSEEKVIYLKSADVSGMPSLKVLDYTIRGENAKETKPEYATKAEVEALAEKISAMKTELTAKKRRAMREEEDDE